MEEQQPRVTSPETVALVATLEARHTQGLLSPYFKTRAEGKTTHHARCKHENTLFDNRLLSLHPRTHAIKRLPQALAHLSKRLQQNSHFSILGI